MAATFLARLDEVPVSVPGGEGERHLKAFRAHVAETDAGLAKLMATPKLAQLLAGAFDGSSYLRALVELSPARLNRVLTAVPEDLFTSLTQEMRAATTNAAGDMQAAKQALRTYKNAVALLTALCDLGGVWPVMTVTHVLSEAADAAVSEAVRFLFRAAVAKGQWQSSGDDAPEASSGYFVLAMGKQGAFELNYSSDIDLIVFFDREKSKLLGGGDLQTFFVRLTRDLVVLLEDRTADGYVFRTDLRLRPDAGATQVALSTVAAHGYYETVGQNWERAAMIKARCCAGDAASGEEFLSELAPFIWRKYLDFAAIADIHAMKRQIHAHKGIGGITVPGQNVKLGRGGIREIEFFAQTQQLIAGGRQSDLRVRATLDALKALEARGWVKPDIRADLTDAYVFLRRLEHRIQMVADEQTQEIPGEGPALDSLARFAGYQDKASFSAAVRAVLETVERHYASLFEGAPELTAAGSNMVFAGATDDPRTVEELARLGYSQPSQVLALVRGWHHGRTPAVRSPQARERLTEVQPLLIAALADTVDPDAAIATFDQFLSELPAGVQLFSLLKANPNLLRLIANIMGSTPRLARILSRRRRLLDAVLDPQALQSDADHSAIDSVLEREFDAARRAASGDPMQDILDTARIVGSEQSFLVGVRLLSGAITAEEAGAAYAMIAERLVAALLKEVTRELEADHGCIPAGAAAVIAMGKLGGCEMTASSDIDLMLVYSCDADAQQSDGPKPLAPSHYYGRLTQRLINAIAAPTAQGALYEVDMRLRPSGQKGPVATRLSSFKSYQETEAWTWEHMALTRARVIAGPDDLKRRVEADIRAVLTMPRESAKIAADVRDMRQRIASEKGTDNLWDLKQARGGLVDLEFIAQYLQLVHAARHPKVLNQNTLTALGNMVAEGVLERQVFITLNEAGRLLHDLTQILRLSLDHAFEPKSAPAGLKALLAQAASEPSFSALEARLKDVMAAVHKAFDALIQPA